MNFGDHQSFHSFARGGTSAHVIFSVGQHEQYTSSRLPTILGTARTMARVYADVNQHMPKSYWEYDSVNITWGVLENYEVVRKIGGLDAEPRPPSQAS